MRLVISKRTLPRNFVNLPGATGIVAEFDTKVSRYGRLAAKVVIFDTPRSLRTFWKIISPHNDLGRHCRGAVNGLACEIERVHRDGRCRRRLEVDKRYFCIVGLCKEHLTAEIVTHEAVHAGFAYAKRQKRAIFANALELDEEQVCYPAGRIANAIAWRMKKLNLIS